MTTPAIVALHGFCRHGQDFDVLRAHLPPTWRWDAPDLAGWGDAKDAVLSDYGYAAQAAWLGDRLTTRYPDGVILVGHSMGGGVAVMLAAAYPDWVRGLLLLAPGGVRHPSTPFLDAVLAGQQPFHGHQRENIERMTSMLFAASQPSADVPVTYGAGDLAFEQGVLDAIARSRHSLAPSRAAKKVSCPVHILVGSKDGVTHPDVGKAYQALMPQAVLHELSGVGHMLMHEATDAVVAQLEALMASAQAFTPSHL